MSTHFDCLNSIKEEDNNTLKSDENSSSNKQTQSKKSDRKVNAKTQSNLDKLRKKVVDNL